MLPAAKRGGEFPMQRVLFLAFLLMSATQAVAELTGAEKRVADQIIKQCRDVYKHKRPCPCPYDQAKGDELCSVNSAYDKKSAASLFCERGDVKPEDIVAFRAMNESFITARCTAR
jgi:hypothetical protein